MYHNAPGLTNEHVPLNDTGYLLPLPQARWEAVLHHGMWQGPAGGMKGCMQRLHAMWQRC